MSVGRRKPRELRTEDKGTKSEEGERVKKAGEPKLRDREVG